MKYLYCRECEDIIISSLGFCLFLSGKFPHYTGWVYWGLIFYTKIFCGSDLWEDMSESVRVFADKTQYLCVGLPCIVLYWYLVRGLLYSYCSRTSCIQIVSSLISSNNEDISQWRCRLETLLRLSSWVFIATQTNGGKKIIYLVELELYNSV